MATKSTDIPSTDIGSLPLLLVLRTKLIPVKGAWNLLDEVLGTVIDITGLPITYDYLVSIDGRNYLIYPDDIPILSRLADDPSRLDTQSLSFRVINTKGEIKQLQLTPGERKDGVSSKSPLPADVVDQEFVVKRIHDPKLLEAVLASSENFIEILEPVRDEGVIVDFRWIVVNPMARSLLGDVLGKQLLNHYPAPELARRLFDHYRSVMETESLSGGFELNFNTSVLNRWFHVALIKTGEWIVVTSLDITEAKTTDKLVQKQLQLLKQTEDVAEMGSWEFDRKENKFHWSDGMYRIFGLEKGTPVEPEVYIIFAAPEDEAVVKKIVNIFRNDPMPFVETIHIKTHEKTKTIKVEGAVLKDEKGEAEKIVGIDLDITALTESEQAVKQQSHFISNVVSTIPDTISVINLKTRKIEYINKEPFPSLSAEELVSMDPDQRLQLVHPEDVPPLKAYFQTFASADDNLVSTVEYRAKANGANWQWFRAHGKVFSRSKDGTATHCVNVVRNITGTKKSQDDLIRIKEALAQRAQSMYDELFRSIDQGFTIIQLVYDDEGRPYDGNIEQSNPALERITGITGIVGKQVRQLVPDAPDDWFRTFAKVVSTQEPLRFTVKAHELGSRWYDIHAFPTGEPRLQKVAVLFNDVTERIISEQTLRDKQLKLQIAQRAARVGVWTYIPALKHGIATKEWMELTGHPTSSETWSIGTLLNLVHSDDAPRVREAFELAAQRQSGLDVEFRIRRPVGEVAWFLMRGSYIPSGEGKDDALMGSIVDITDRKAFEDQKDQFIGVASHELKTPVTSIKAYAELLQGFFEEKNKSAQAIMMERMVSQVDRLSKLINDLLDTTKISGGGLILEPEEFDINSVIVERIEEMQNATKHKLIAKLENVPLVFADKDRISQVLTNLLSNAIKYSPGESDIIISSHQSGDSVIIKVRDFGIGMSENFYHKIFERFFRVNDEQRNTATGLGLGLFIASEIIRKHHGTIGVESKKGQGSEFFFSLPLHRVNLGDDR